MAYLSKMRMQDTDGNVITPADSNIMRDIASLIQTLRNAFAFVCDIGGRFRVNAEIVTLPTVTANATVTDVTKIGTWNANMIPMAEMNSYSADAIRRYIDVS